MSDQPLVYNAINGVMADLQAIAKDRKVQEGPARFAFRGVDDVMNALHDPLVKHGLVILPQVLERMTETRQTSKGGTMNVTHLRVRFRFVAMQDGSSDYAEAWGEGQDSGDKSTGKAHSMAYKSALLQAFHVETEDTPDADRDTTPAAPAELAPWVLPLQERINALEQHQRDWLLGEWQANQWPKLGDLDHDQAVKAEHLITLAVDAPKA